ncbi:5-formyltetrahydrofolate cyclo-ligase [Bifidobacterium callimiconis]|uniref:5-formyltetrahydrofolate cyclo-ligase n=1 Tax=Bifidobacterium callimiconis TaxID=2306973 RepID=A0A430FCB1_9BIFI|nr:5-formyltetrahydrofolate cyclo-ligase [Bifidobacterium callimiconis]MBT1177420.1 5-formyltetrahydrofolate cyclo-ligase [Bifidobacterium callimiconis]RSX50473.1 5-formyltetrahydrofolate cyclo-ligase [Bifidobacterium callimiconis]
MSEVANEPVDLTFPDDVHDKSALRHVVLARRRLTTPEERESAGERLADAAMEAGLFDDVRTVAAYVSMGTEVSTLPLLRDLLARDVRVLVPRLGAGRDLGWGVLERMDDLADAGERRPQEPDGETLPAEAIADADMTITAAVLVNHDGWRLGRGGGWYDRMLALRRPGTSVTAVVWPWEFVDRELPREDHDMPVDGVLTPEGFARVR